MISSHFRLAGSIVRSLASEVRRTLNSFLMTFVVVCVASAVPTAFAQNDILLELIDPSSQAFVPARIEFTKSGKKLTKDRKQQSVGNLWLGEGSLAIKPPPGDYEFNVRRGPEFKDIVGGFSVQRGGKDTVSIEIPRSIDMHAEYWFSGDHGANLTREPLQRWQAAEALDLVVSLMPPAPSTPPAKSPKKQKQGDAPELTDDPEIIGYQLFTSSTSISMPELGVVIHGVEAAKAIPPTASGDGAAQDGAATNAWESIASAESNTQASIEISQLWSRDVPILLASSAVRSVQLLSSVNRPNADDRFVASNASDAKEFGRITMTRGNTRMAVPIFAPFDTLDRIRYKEPRGVGMLTEDLYWKMLESGLHLTPTAASGFGIGETYLGYNRTYVHCEDSFTAESYWSAVRSGETFVTNGPLLRAMINGQPPGSVFPSYRRQPIPLDFSVSLAVREPVDYLDVVFNGETLYSAKLEDHYRRGEFPPLEIKESGWLVIRVVTAHDEGYRMATTAPFYFEFDGQRRISKKAVAFFQQWLARSEEVVRGENELSESVRSRLQKAHAYWDDLESKSNAP